MEKLFFISLIVFKCFFSSAQQSNRFATLDRFFAGIPLQSTFENWFDFISEHPHLGVDSTTKKGNYSSFKQGIENYFPFPNSLSIKILFKNTIFVDPTTFQIVDSFKTIDILGDFGINKAGRKESVKFYKGLRKELMKNYRYEFKDYEGEASWFYKGKNRNFPNCSLHFGYSEELKFYYVILSYDDQKSKIIKSYPPPDNTLRH